MWSTAARRCIEGWNGGFDTSHLEFLHRGTADTSRLNFPSRYKVVATDFGLVAGTGLDPTSYRARSTRFRLPKGDSFRQTVEDQLRATVPAYAK